MMAPPRAENRSPGRSPRGDSARSLHHAARHYAARICAVAAALALSLPCSGAHADEAFVSGEMLFKLCDAQQRLLRNPGNELVDPESAYEAYECRFYIAGVADALSSSDPFRDCIPKTAKSDDLVAIVHDFLARNHLYWRNSGFKVAASAFVGAFHCKVDR